MTAALYCAPRDVYELGVPRGSVPNPGRIADSADAATDAIALDVHGLDPNDPLQLRAEAGGALPAPLVALTTYYADPLDDNRFGVRATAGGARIDLTTAGSSIVVIVAVPMSAAIAWASRIVDDNLPAHAVPVTAPVPETIKAVTAGLAAWKLMVSRGPVTKSLEEILTGAQAQLARWAKGVPLRGENTPPRTNLAAAATARARDPRGWSSFGGIE
jgi:hypothetical protein